MLSRSIFFLFLVSERWFNIWSNPCNSKKTLFCIQILIILSQMNCITLPCCHWQHQAYLAVHDCFAHAVLRQFLKQLGVFEQVRGKSKKSVSWSRLCREVRFFAWCSACLKYQILYIFRCCKILTIFAVFHGKFWSENFPSF